MKKAFSVSVIFASVLLVFLAMMSQTASAEEIVWNINPTPLPAPTFRHSSIAYNGKVYLIGTYGGGGQESPLVYYADVNFDGTLGSWHETTPLPEWREYAAVVVWNDFVYVIGGAGPAWGGRSEQHTVYFTSINPDGTVGEWATTTQLPERISGFGAVVWNRRIYVAGGWNGYSRQDEVYFAHINEVNGSIGNWQTTTSLPIPLNGMCALTYESTMFIIGGIYASETQSSVFCACFDETDGTLGSWTSTSSLPEGRAKGGCALVGDEIYVVGGRGGHEGVDETPKETIYVTTAEANGVGSWAETESLPEGRREHSVVTVDRRIYVMGGRDLELSPSDIIYYSSPPTVPATVDIDPDTLNLKSKGKWITAYIEFPVGYDVNDINVSTVMLNDTVSAELYPTEVGDKDGDGVPDLMVKFDRAEVISYILSTIGFEKFAEVTLTIAGYLNDGTPFEGNDTIRIVFPRSKYTMMCL